MGNPIHPIHSPSPPPRPTAAVASRTSGASTAASSDDGALQQPMLDRPSISLVQPPRRRRPVGLSRPLRLFRSLCRTLPIFSPKCGHLPAPCKIHSSALHPSSLSSDSRLFPSSSSSHHRHHSHHGSSSSSSSSSTRITGTLFGHRRGRVSLCLQQNPRCLPSLVVELAMQTHALLREVGSGMVRLALECEKRAGGNGNGNGRDGQRRLLDEPLWTMFCNGKKSGYGVRREATEQDLAVMETLKPVSVGAGVMPRPEGGTVDGETAYVRSFFEHVVGSRDSETLYMISPDGGNGPELTIFFIRI